MEDGAPVADMTPDDIARIRHNCVEPDRYLGERYALALCDALEAAWAERDGWKREEDRAALARVRDLCDKQGFDITPAQVRAAIKGDNQ